MKEINIKASIIHHKDEDRIALMAPNNPLINNFIRTIKGSK